MLAFHEQVVCFTIRALFTSLFVRRSKVGGLQPLVAMAAIRGQEEGRSNFYLFFFPLFLRNTRISTHREFNPRAFRERRLFLLGNSVLFISDCEWPPPCWVRARANERASFFADFNFGLLCLASSTDNYGVSAARFSAPTSGRISENQ